MNDVDLDLATLDDVIAELEARPNERPWVLMHRKPDGEWRITGKPTLDAHEVADTLHHFLGWLLLYMRFKSL